MSTGENPNNTPALSSVSREAMRSGLRALSDPSAMLEEIFANAPVGLQIYARDGRCVLVNPMHTELFGGIPPPEYNVFEDTLLIERGVAALIRRAFEGERIVIPPIWYDIRELRNIAISAGGRRVAVGAELVPLRPNGGAVEHVLFVFHDVTAAHEAREQAEASALLAEQGRAAAEKAAAQSAFLAEATRVLSGALDYELTLARLARLAAPAVADFCIVDLLEHDGSMRRVAAVHADPAAQPVLDELRRTFPPRPGSPQPAARVMASGEPELLSAVDDTLLNEHTTNPEHHALMLRLAVRSHLAVPLQLGDRTLGALSFGYVGTRRYTQADLPLIEALASRAAVAIDNSRLYRDAEAARAEAEAANQAKDEFLAMLGHELRNPLAPIVTALELTRQREAPSREQAVIERQVQHLRRLVDDLLDVGRIARGKLTLALQPIELAEAVADGLELARPLIDERNHHLTLQVAPTGLLLSGDRVRLAQVLANLLTNAARYTDPGGSISLTAERRDQQLILRVRDTGIGMPPELLPRVFELFAQGKRPIDRGQGGLGLGLSVVKSLVGLHGGSVEARSEGLGRGSELTVVLPALEPLIADESVDASAQVSPSPAPQPRVMVVDDNVDAAELLAECLALTGYQTFVAHDPHAALKLARVCAPHVALLDIGLPIMDGYELARRLRADPDCAATVLIALTGYGQRGDRERSQKAGFSGHLVKPVDLRELNEVIRSLLPSE